MKTLLIVYHSQSGTCAKLAQAACGGAAQEEEVRTQILRAWDTGIEPLSQASGVLLIAAENSGTLAGSMKDFLDRIFYPAIEKGVVIPYALVISAGNDGRGAASQAQRIVSGIPLVAAAEPLILRGEFDEDAAAAARDLGQAMAVGLSMGIY